MSDGNLEPKTIDDYRDIVKILKLKVMKQMKRIQQLEEKVRFYETQDLKSATKDTRFEAQAAAKDSPMSRDFDYSNLKNKSIVMYLFQKGAKKLGLNLEGIFRYADVDYKNEIDSDFFRSLLSKMNLGLTLKQVSCLIFIFDEDCTGVITRSEYYNSLEAYQVCDQIVSQAYTQDCLMKLSELFEQKKVDVSTFYDEYSRGQSRLDLNTFEEAIKKKFGKSLQDREIIAAFNQIDFESQGYVEKNNFIYSLRAYITKLKTNLAESRLVPDGTHKKPLGQSSGKFKEGGGPIQKNPTPKPDVNNSRLRQSIREPIKPIKEEKSLQNVKPNTDQNPTESAKSGAMSLQQILEDLANQKLTLKGLYPSILELNFDRPITLQIFSKIIRQLSEGVKHSTISHLFRLMDRDQRGTIHFSELLQFYIRTNGQMDTIFRILTRAFDLDGQNTEKFFFINQFDESDQISGQQFKTIFSNRFGLEKELFADMWKYFDKQGTDRVKVSTIIKELSTYELQ